MREHWARSIALFTGVLVLLLAALFAYMQNQPQNVASSSELLKAPVPTFVSKMIDPALIEAGRKVYDQQNCALCHSIAGEGNPRNPLDGVGSKYDEQAIKDRIIGADSVKESIAERAFKLKQAFKTIAEAELNALTRYMQSLRLQTASDESANISTAVSSILTKSKDGNSLEVPTIKAFVGSEKCATCHQDENKHFLESGHPFKITKINGAPPKIPFLPAGVSAPKNHTWDDISYTVGGYGWKMRFIDKKGYLITQVEGSQFNIGNMTQSVYNASVPNGTEKYTCGNCHTTGWKTIAEGASPMDGLEGMGGSWYAPGVQCEACHGKGSIHSVTKNPTDIVKDASIEACSTCHQRRKTTGDTKQQTSGGWENHRNQVEQILTNQHGLNGMTCTSCHDPHASTKHDLIASGTGIRKTCNDCHTETTYSKDTHFSAECTDCHMPKTAKNAISINKYVGDAPNHNFKINTSATASYLTADESGTWANLDKKGSTLDFSCYSCHKDAEGIGGKFSTKTMSELAAKAATFHK